VADEGWRVELGAYEGPMDLLLYLIQKEEVDVHDIPVARILEKYLEVLRASPVLDLDRAGEFLVMASTLMALKSAMLLPGGDAEVEALVDPREELVRQLIEYRRVKAAGEDLRRRREEASLRWPRGASPLPSPPAGEEGPEPPGVREVTLFDVFAAFHRLLRETQPGETRRIVYDEVPQETHIERILGVLREGAGWTGLEGILGGRRDRPFVLGSFLAVLELMKEGRVLAVQGAAGAAIEVVLRDSDAGREALEALRARSARSEAESPPGPPRRRPPWRKTGDGEGPPEAGEPGPA